MENLEKFGIDKPAFQDLEKFGIQVLSLEKFGI